MIYTPADNAELAAITVSSGDSVLFRTGVTYSASSLPSTLTAADNVTLGYIGTGTKPIISGGTVRADWTYDAPNNVYSRPAYAANILGNVTEDGVPMKFTAWNVNIATTAAAMATGASLPAYSGSMTYDYINRIVYIRPSAGVPSEHVYIVSDNADAVTGSCIANSTASRRLVIEGLDIRHISRHAIVLYNKVDPTIRDCDFRVIGGIRPSTLWMGNAVELSRGCHGAQVLRCSASDIFDTAFTTQLYEGTAAEIGSHLYENNTVTRFGMHGIEVSVQTSNQSIHDIEINGLIGTDQGQHSWAGDRNGALVTNLSNVVNSSRITRSFARNVTGSRLRRLYIGLGHGGVCGIENSSAAGSMFTVVGSSNGSTGQVDLHKSVSDNGGAPSGGTFSAITASTVRHFQGWF